MISLKRTTTSVIAAGLFVVSLNALAQTSVNRQAVINHYADLAQAVYSDSLTTAMVLSDRVNELIEQPSETALQAARQAWMAARIPYGQSEVFRFGNPNVDAWEGTVNAWPLDEGLIDYVAHAYEHEDGNAFASANLIAGDEPIEAALLTSYHEKGGSEANVATGYHAIEFLLWGQDLNEPPSSAGQRPYTDYLKGDACTHGHCERRGQYLRVVTELLVDDLKAMVADWEQGKKNYRQAFMQLDENEALRRILFGMGSLSLGELAGERLNVALLAHSQEDEHSCFSDNTHVDIAENARGIQNIFLGHYIRTDGSKVAGPGLVTLVASKDRELSESLQAKLAMSQQHAQAIVEAAVGGEPFDQQIRPGNEAGNARVKALIDALRAQTVAIEAVFNVLGINSLNPESSTAFGG